MDRLLKFYDKIKNKEAKGLVWVLTACLVVVVALIFLLPSARAGAPTEVTWTGTDNGNGTYLYKLSDITSQDSVAQILANEGATYIIDGSGTSKDNPAQNIYLQIVYNDAVGTEAKPAKVNVVLKNVNMSRTYDQSIISFETKSNVVDFHVTVEGECNFTSNIFGMSVTPVIAVEDIQYSLMKLSPPTTIPKTVNDYVISADTIRRISLYLEGDNSESALNITVTDTEAYGAVIGSCEAGAMKARVDKFSNEDMAELIKRLNDELYNQHLSQISISNPDILQAVKDLGFVTKVGEKNVFVPQYIFGGANACGAGKVVIGGANGEAPIRVSIANNGYGASIGGGAGSQASFEAAWGSSVSESDRIVTNVLSQKITINAGTVYITSSRASTDAIGTGAIVVAEGQKWEEKSVSGVEINGGSIFISSAGRNFSVAPVNKAGDRVYLVKADSSSNTDGKKISNLQGLAVDDKIPLEYIYEEGLDFAADLSSDNVTKSFVVKNIAGDNSSKNVLDVTINLLTPYSYKGAGHSQDDKLYFYLPATESTNLTISDEFGPGSGDSYASYVVTDESGNVISPISSDPTDNNSRKYVLIRGKKYYVKATPPKNLDLKKVSLNKGAGPIVPELIDSKGYVVETDVGAVMLTFNYGGTIDIIYENGFIKGDENNHDIAAVMPREDYIYGTAIHPLPQLGTIMKPKNKNIKDLIFAGWQYIKEDGSKGPITHLTKSDTEAVTDNHIPYTDIIWDDGTIHLEATWKIEISYSLDASASMSVKPQTVEILYGSGTDYKTSITVPTEKPYKLGYAFTGWYLDDGTVAEGTLSLSTLTSHKITSTFERDGFRVYIDASKLDTQYAQFYCVSSSNEANQLLETDGDGVPKVIDINGVKYYRTVELHSNDPVKILIKTVSGYIIKEISIKADATKCSTDIGELKKDMNTGNYYVDFTMGKEDVYVKLSVSMAAQEYSIIFKDGKSPNEQLWKEYSFLYTLQDIDNGTTIGDIIRRGMGKTVAQLSDADIANLVNGIDKNDRFTTFAGWRNVFITGTHGSDLTIQEVLADSNITGNLMFTAEWNERGKVRINLSVMERRFLSDNEYKDSESKLYKGKLYYLMEDGTKTPVYTEYETDPVTGETIEIAYASPDDTLYIDVYEIDEYGNMMGTPVNDSLNIVQLYYWYTSIRGEDGYINVHKDPLTSFNVEDEVANGTNIDVYLVYAVKSYKIIYWNLYGHDNSMNPTSFTIYDEFDFIPIVEGVDWLLVCQDTDITNFDEVKTEVITGIDVGGKPRTDGVAGQRDYVSNIVLMPDWRDIPKEEEKEKEYTITIIVDTEEYGTVTITQPINKNSYKAEQLILLEALAKEGYELVPESLVYKKDNSRVTFGLVKGVSLKNGELDTFPLQEIDKDSGKYLFTMPASDVIVYATFRLREYNIIYENMDVDILNPNPKTYNMTSNIILKDIAKEGYTFEGWYDIDGNKVENIANRTGDIILMPKFEIIVVEPEPEPEPPTEEPTTEEPTTKPEEEPPTEEPTEPPTQATVETKPITIVGRPSNIIVNGGTYTPVKTGDETDVPRLVLICVAAVLLLLIVIIKKPKDEEEEEIDGDATGKQGDDTVDKSE